MPRTKSSFRRKPTKPYPSFPLTAHNNGQWCKKIRGRVHFFGVWDDPQAALERYLGVAADLHARRQPSISNLPGDGPTVKEVCNHFLSYQIERAQTGEIGHRWFEDCRCVVERFAGFTGPGRLVADVRPDEFRRFRQSLVRKGLGRKSRGLGVHALNRAITVVRGMLKHAYEMGLIDRPVRYGKAFDRPSKTVKRKNRLAIEREHGKRLFQPAEVLAMIRTAELPLRAMILLGINGGLGNGDCASLPRSAVDLARGVLEFARPKTGIERIVPLWPETVHDLRQVVAAGSPSSRKASNLVFLTPRGLPWVREKIHKAEESGVTKVTRVDAVAKEFEQLIAGLGLKRRGMGFYALRHTFRTWADEVKDQHAIHRIMGHAIPGMSGIYVEEIGLDRLRAVVDHVRARLFAADG